MHGLSTWIAITLHTPSLYESIVHHGWQNWSNRSEKCLTNIHSYRHFCGRLYLQKPINFDQATTKLRKIRSIHILWPLHFILHHCFSTKWNVNSFSVVITSQCCGYLKCMWPTILPNEAKVFSSASVYGLPFYPYSSLSEYSCSYVTVTLPATTLMVYILPMRYHSIPYCPANMATGKVTDTAHILVLMWYRYYTSFNSCVRLPACIELGYMASCAGYWY